MSLFKEFLKHPLHTGAVTPSSRFLIRNMLKPIDFTQAKTIIELGPGEGNITTNILKRMRQDAKLYSIELNPELANSLKEETDPRLTVIEGNAKDLTALLNNTKADAIISGLPLGAMNQEDVHQLLNAIERSLEERGVFTQFQYTPRWDTLLREYFDVTTTFTILNIPPARVYLCTKKKIQ